jgi:eukaryotic-like serine/threonine-protein kinase
VREPQGENAGPSAAPSTSAAPAPSASTTAAPPSAAATSPSAAASADGGAPAGNGNGNATGPLPPAPAGWRIYRDPTGFQLYVPVGWTRSQEGSIVYFRDYTTGRVLGIDQTNQPKADPVADWTSQAAYRVARGDFPGYRQIKIVAVPYFRSAADWEFTYNGRNGRVHVLNRGFVVSSTKAHGIWWQTPDSQWAANLPNLQLIFNSFRPA